MLFCTKQLRKTTVPANMLKRGVVTISMFSNSTMLVGLCRPRRRLRRRRGSSIRLGNKRRGFCLGSRPVIQWGVMAPLRMLKKIIMEITPKENWIEAYCWSLPFLRPQLFPLCWSQVMDIIPSFFFSPTTPSKYKMAQKQNQKNASVCLQHPLRR